jgi:muramoyltetrapeptide carboxypeptidase
LRNATDLDRSIANARGLGWEPVVGDHVLERDGYLAGSDASRLADLNRFARDDSIDAIWCVRGGYGTMRILEHIDYDAWRARPKALIGYSDVTALHAAIGQRAGIVTFHGPTARAELTPNTRSSLVRAVASPDTEEFRASRTEVTLAGTTDPAGEGQPHAPRRSISGMRSLKPGRAEGHLVGGNLALVAALVGTPYAWDLDGAILVLEDVSESVYRLDRMFTQLWLSGGLKRVAGLVFGQFTDIPDDASNADRPLERLLAEVAQQCGVPTLANFPLGHVDEQFTLPLGVTATIDATACTLSYEPR